LKSRLGFTLGHHHRSIDRILTSYSHSYYFAEFIFPDFALTFPDKLDDFPLPISLRAAPNKPILGAKVYNRSLLYYKI